MPRADEETALVRMVRNVDVAIAHVSESSSPLVMIETLFSLHQAAWGNGIKANGLWWLNVLRKGLEQQLREAAERDKGI